MKVVDLYCELLDEERCEFVMMQLLHDLLHVCDRHPELGDLEEKVVDALYSYAEGIWDTSTARELSRLLQAS